MSPLWRFSLLLVLSLGIAAFALPGALAWLRPTWLRFRRLEGDDVRDLPDALTTVVAELTAQGFTYEGSHRQAGPLRPMGEVHRFIANDGGTVALATVEQRRGHVRLFSVFEGGAGVLTSERPVPAFADEGWHMSGAMPGAPLPQRIAAHRRRVAAMAEHGRAQLPLRGAEAFEAAERAWLAGAGSASLRRRHRDAPFVFALALFTAIQAAVGLHRLDSRGTRAPDVSPPQESR